VQRVKRFAFSFAFFVAIAICGSRRLPAADSDSSANDELINTIGTLLSDKDKDIRAEGLQQVRESAKGTAATQRFAAMLPKFPAEAQIGLLDALADRGDKAARPAVLELLSASDSAVRIAALRALGSLGEPADAPRLLEALRSHSADERATACASITHLAGEDHASRR
jgi:HEAT repeat protein